VEERAACYLGVTMNPGTCNLILLASPRGGVEVLLRQIPAPKRRGHGADLGVGEERGPGEVVFLVLRDGDLRITGRELGDGLLLTEVVGDACRQRGHQGEEGKHEGSHGRAHSLGLRSDSAIIHSGYRKPPRTRRGSCGELLAP